MIKRLLVAAATSAAILGSYAQINSPAPDGYLARAVAMYDDANYFGCIDQLTKIDCTRLSVDEAETLSFYRALASVHTDKSSAIRLLLRFMDEYPASLRRSQAMLALGDCYYGSDYTEALSVYRRINPQTLDTDKADDLRYRTAYCHLMLEQYDQAQPLFAALASSPRYANASKFYQGYLAYVGGKYADAERLLKTVDTSTAPGNMADFYLSQIYFVRDDYSKALSMAKSLLKRPGIAIPYVAEANHIAGESAYRLSDDKQAEKYLNEYLSMTEKPLPTALYILGLIAYGQGDFTEAVDYLTDVTVCDNAMGQSAYLYLGQAYLHQADYSAAAMAFNRALNMDYDTDVRETAYYNYAVASANGGKAPFASTVKVFSDFLRIYPDSRYAPEVQNYIISSYLTDGNYTAALQSINEMKSPSAETLKAKQRVLYVLGNKALAAADYTQALNYLDEANTLAKYDKTLAPEVSLALGEALYRKGQYAKAVTEIQKYLKTNPKGQNVALAYYDLGYALYAQKKYGEAAVQLQKCLNAPGALPSEVIADAYNRLGDCHYFAKDFAKASTAYDAAYKQNPSAGDYALFQKALMAGYQRQYTQKLQNLERLEKEFPTSALIPDALLEATESYLQLGENQNAIEVYEQLVARYPNTAQGRQGYLQMALVKLNSGNRTAAIQDYKEIIRRYPASDEARQAVEQMKRIAAADGTVNELMAFLRTIETAPQIDESEAEQLTFEEAEREYLNDKSLAKLVTFIDEYPESSMRPRALSYLMEGNANAGNPEQAYMYATTLVERYPSSPYTISALEVKAKEEERQGKGNLALRTWQQLAQSASSPQTILKARMGVLRTGRDGNNYDAVLEAADAVLASAGVGADDMAQARYSKGWVLDARGDEAGARAQWEKIADNTDMLYGIMSAQSIGESYMKEKNYAQAETWAKRVTNADSPHAYWIARGFILLSDVYAARGDKYKARQYLEAVRDNYTGTETDIFEMIDQRLK